MRSKERLYIIIFVLGCLGVAVGLSLYALKDNISYFRTPSEAHTIAPGRAFRLGGLVKEGSIRKNADTPAIEFVVTDLKDEIRVRYTGILPDLFREGQGVVATGVLDAEGIFIATQLLAKHDENYMPPELAKGLQKAHEEGSGKK